MKKQGFKTLCTQYGANPRAVKEIIKKDGLKRKEIEPVQLLELIYVNAPDLLFCRNAGNETVEYANPTQAKKLIRAINEMREA